MPGPLGGRGLALLLVLLVSLVALPAPSAHAQEDDPGAGGRPAGPDLGGVLSALASLPELLYAALLRVFREGLPALLGQAVSCPRRTAAGTRGKPSM